MGAVRVVVDTSVLVAGLPSQLGASGLVLAAIARQSITPLVTTARPQLRDPADELMLETAVNGHVEVIVTHNVTDFEPASSRFGLRILTPAQLLKELRKP